MNELIKTEDLQTVEAKLRASVTAFEKNWPVINDTVKRAKLALSTVKQVTTDAEDAIAEKALVKCRVTFEKIEGLRKEGTVLLDEIKSLAMQPEKEISTDPKAAQSEYNRIKKMRDAYANIKHQQNEANKKKLALEAAKKEELIRLKNLAETTVLNFVMDSLVNLEKSLEGFFAKVKLEEWEVFEKKFNAKPNLKKESFENIWLEFSAAPGTLTLEEFANLFFIPARAQLTYEKVNSEYQEKGFTIVNSWKEKLPSKKADLEKLAALRETNALAASVEERRQGEEQLKQSNAKAAELEALRQTQAQQLEEKQNEEKLNAVFEQTVASQAIEEVKGRKKKAAIIECKPEEVVQVFANVLYACFMNTKFEGHLKKDKKGALLPKDIHGVPVYTDWAAELLDFFANNCNPIAGVRFVEKVSSIAKSK